MKQFIFSISLLLSAMTMNGAVKVNKVEPANWFVGMKNPSLQLMVYGKDIKNADVKVDYNGVKLDRMCEMCWGYKSVTAKES